jgi:hypothetical protein
LTRPVQTFAANLVFEVAELVYWRITPVFTDVEGLKKKRALFGKALLGDKIFLQ